MLLEAITVTLAWMLMVFVRKNVQLFALERVTVPPFCSASFSDARLQSLKLVSAPKITLATRTITTMPA